MEKISNIAQYMLQFYEIEQLDNILDFNIIIWILILTMLIVLTWIMINFSNMHNQNVKMMWLQKCLSS
jgi:hypothetical protein